MAVASSATEEVFVGPAEQPLFLVVLSAALLAAVHLFGGRLTFLGTNPRGRLLSAASGVSVSYVFLHLLPEVDSASNAIEAETPAIAFVESHAYLVALAGFVLFYGLEWYVRRTGSNRDGTTPASAFWVHLGSFGVYNGLIGYLVVHREDAGVPDLLLFVLAMGLHLLVNDIGLRNHHSDRYRRVGRWLLSGAVLLGVTVGLLTSVADVVVAVLLAFIAGGVVLNVIKEELPEERESRFPAFAAGAAGYGALLLVL